MRLLVILALTMAAVLCEGSRILVLNMIPARSHYIVFEPLFQELAARGHQVTVYSSFPQKKPLANYTDVDLTYVQPSLVSKYDLDMVLELMKSPWTLTFTFNWNFGNICRSVMGEPVFQDLLKKKDQYDLMFYEVSGNDCFAYFAYKMGIPVIGFTSSMMMPWAADRVGLPDNPSYIPNYLVSYTPNMNLWQRTYNTLVLAYAKFWHECVFRRSVRTMVEEIFGEPLPPLNEVLANTSMMFVNSYHALSMSRPFPPNVIELGGIHIKKRQPLTEDFKNILNNAKHGVIVMSFGSLLRTTSLPKPVIKAFMDVFATIPQTVIFKYEEDLPEAPPNVVIRKWVPQRDLIEHENVVAAIVHGGLASTIEVVELGKPTIGIPLFADQFNNIHALAAKEACVQLDLNDLTKEKIETAVREVLFNPKYAENMKKLSLQFRDRPQSALDTAVFWTEYVIRHKGAPHLRPVSVKLPLYQYLLLDVIAVLLLSLSVFLYALYRGGKRLLPLATSLISRLKSPKELESSKKED